MSTFHNLTSLAMDLRYIEVIIRVFLSRLNPLILQSVNLTVDHTIAMAILGWLSTETKVLTDLTLYFLEKLPLANPTSEQHFDLPQSLTSVNLILARSHKLKLIAIPVKVVKLQLDGVITDTTQISDLTELKQLTIDPEVIIGVVDVKTSTRRQLEHRMIRFLTTLPAQLSKVVLTRFQLNPLMLGFTPTPAARYDLYHWLNTRCGERDVRSTVAEIMAALVPSYQQLPFRR